MHKVKVETETGQVSEFSELHIYTTIRQQLCIFQGDMKIKSQRFPTLKSFILLLKQQDWNREK